MTVLRYFTLMILGCVGTGLGVYILVQVLALIWKLVSLLEDYLERRGMKDGKDNAQ